MLVVAITDFERRDLEAHLAAYQALGELYPDGQLAIQVRMPGQPAEAVMRCAERLLSLGLPLFVNGHPAIARALGTGLHLGSRRISLADARAVVGQGAPISVACHDEAEIQAAVRERASLAIVSPVFEVPGKGSPLGIAGLRRLIALAPGLPVVALGGVDARRWPLCREVGAAGFAAIRAFLDISS